MTPKDIVLKHRRHVELSPGVGKDVQDYALAVCDDILADLHEYVSGGWVSVKDRLPKEGEHVLVHFGRGLRPVREGYISRMTYNDKTKKDFDLPLWVDATEQWDGDHGYPEEHHEVTHWMPLPPFDIQRD